MLVGEWSGGADVSGATREFGSHPISHTMLLPYAAPTAQAASCNLAGCLFLFAKNSGFQRAGGVVAAGRRRAEDEEV